MTCPVCESKTRVTDSRDFGDHIVRRRKCLECDHAFYTEEIDSNVAEAEYLEFHRLSSADRRNRRDPKSKIQNIKKRGLKNE